MTGSPPDHTTGPLSGLRVFDMTRVLAGPTCTQILGDLGAGVIKIERPGRGDDSRGMGPPYLTDAQGKDTAESAYFLSVNRNKRSVTLNLTTEEGQELARRMIGKCDVVVENFRTGALAQYGLAYDQIREAYPALVYCSVTGFGQTGPYAERGGYDYLVQGMGGIMSVTGEPGGAPTKVGVGVSDIITGMYAAIAIQAALRHRDLTGEGQHIDMALLDSQVAWLSYVGENYLVSGEMPQRLGNQHPNIMPYQVFRASDGLMVLAVGNDAQFTRFCEFAECPDLAADERYTTNARRVKNRDGLTPVLADIIASKSIAHWVEGLVGVNVPCSPINTIDQVFNDPQVVAREMKINMPHPHLSGETMDLIASPLRLSRSPVSYRQAPPQLGEHTAEVLEELLEMDEKKMAALREKGVI
ncbi:MAG: CaiB/BaiF CoA-transferase family protein [Alphaproteobacteria bacterium]|nr:CaiB/BaiF CoA-transferase family protein [Alphaproteobacteria bacterium]MDP7468814.1 CaiB/BaiF CoA-transferase family protein [Alphaproteobacteria bacterium]